MADRPEIEVHEYHGGTLYIGRKDTLIAAGLAKPEQFPGSPGCGKTSTLFAATQQRRKMKVSRCSTDSYRVLIHWTPEERAAYEEKRSARSREYAAVQESRERQRLAREMTADPGGARGFAERSLKGAMMALYYTFNLADNADRPYSFDAETREEVTKRCRQLMGLFNLGKITTRLGAIAQGDSNFQRFMAATTRQADDG